MTHYAPPGDSGPLDFSTFNASYFPTTRYPEPRYPADVLAPLQSGTYNFSVNNSTETYPLILLTNNATVPGPVALPTGTYILSVLANVGTVTTSVAQVTFVVRKAFSIAHGKEATNGTALGSVYLGASPSIPANTVGLINVASSTGNEWGGYSLVKNNFTLSGGVTLPISVVWTIEALNLTVIPSLSTNVLSAPAPPYYAGSASFATNTSGSQVLVTESALSGKTLNLSNGLYMLTLDETGESLFQSYSGGVVFGALLSNSQQVYTVFQRLGSASSSSNHAGLFIYDTTNQLFLKNNLATAHNARWFIYKFL